ncbi:MAG TPA: hypothetical protein VJ824_15005 [Bacillota bacterium]|nr:hypothetical protein [Bacillota bacterium]
MTKITFQQSIKVNNDFTLNTKVTSELVDDIKSKANRIVNNFYTWLLIQVLSLKSEMEQSEKVDPINVETTKDNIDNFKNKLLWTESWLKEKGMLIFDPALNVIFKKGFGDGQYNKLDSNINRLKRRYEIVSTRNEIPIFERGNDQLNWILEAPFLLNNRLASISTSTESDLKTEVSGYQVRLKNPYEIQQDSTVSSERTYHFLLLNIRRLKRWIMQKQINILK